MEWFLKGIAVLFIAAGAGEILYTEEIRRGVSALMKDSHRKPLAVGAAVGGVLLLMAMGSSRYGWFVGLLGVAAIVKAAVFWFNPGDLFRKIRAFYLESASEKTHRLYGIVMLVIGTALLSWVA
ncbi:MAG: hypothetical protein PVH30_00200 [Desulfobacterales bacterium]|jgi:hypothetical protein